MDLKVRDSLARGKVVVASRRGTFVSEHDTVDAAMDDSLKVRRFETDVIGPLKPEEREKMQAYLDRLRPPGDATVAED
jgi:hypothetical protein